MKLPKSPPPVPFDSDPLPTPAVWAETQAAPSHGADQYGMPPTGEIYQRPWTPYDEPLLVELHEQWFPVRYADQFWENACVGMNEDGNQRLHTSVACREAAADGSEDVLGAVSCILIPLYDWEDYDLLEDESQLTGPAPMCSHVMCVETLGVRTEIRRQGIASKLLQHCEDLAGQHPGCGMVLLHVITYNQSAVDFYEKHGYTKYRFCEDYYIVDGENYDSWMFVKKISRRIDHSLSQPLQGMSLSQPD